MFSRFLSSSLAFSMVQFVKVSFSRPALIFCLHCKLCWNRITSIDYVLPDRSSTSKKISHKPGCLLAWWRVGRRPLIREWLEPSTTPGTMLLPGGPLTGNFFGETNYCDIFDMRISGCHCGAIITLQKVCRPHQSFEPCS